MDRILVKGYWHGKLKDNSQVLEIECQVEWTNCQHMVRILLPAKPYVTTKGQSVKKKNNIKMSPFINDSGIYHINLTLRLLMSYIYGAPSKARNANVVYIWNYVWQS